MRIYLAKYQPAGFSWDEYRDEPAWLIETAATMWLEEQKQMERAARGNT